MAMSRYYGMQKSMERSDTTDQTQYHVVMKENKKIDKYLELSEKA